MDGLVAAVSCITVERWDIFLGRPDLSDHVMKMHNESLVYIWKIQFRKSLK